MSSYLLGMEEENTLLSRLGIYRIVLEVMNPRVISIDI